MATATTASLDSLVKSYVRTWEFEVSEKIQATKMDLMWCSNHERAYLKTDIKTLFGVLDLLQGKKTNSFSKSELRKEMAAVKLKLNAAEEKYKETFKALCVERKINKDFRIQLNKSNLRNSQTALAVAQKTQELRSELKTIQLDYASRLSLKNAINMDLSSKLEEAHKRLQQPPSQRSTEIPDDLSELLLQLKKSTSELERHVSSIESSERDGAAEPKIEETLQGARTSMDLCVKLQELNVQLLQKAQEVILCNTEREPTALQIPPAPAAETAASVESLGSDRASVSELQLKAPEEEAPKVEEEEKTQFKMEDLESDCHAEDVQLIEKEEEKVLCLKKSQLQNILDDSVSQAWEEKEAMLKSQRAQIATLQHTVRMTEEQLKVQWQESRKALKKKEKDWAQKFDEMKSTFETESVKRPRRRNWFLRMFACGSGRDVQE